MNWLIKIGFIAWFKANIKIFFRVTSAFVLIYILNNIYDKYEVLLLATNPEKLFIPLYAYTILMLMIIIWVTFSFKHFTNFKNAKKLLEVKDSYYSKSNKYSDIEDVVKHPKLKTISEGILKK